MRLDEDKLETLRSWGRGLREAGSEESAAAGRAILMLIEEIERLQLEFRRVSAVLSDDAADDLDKPLASTLHERLQREAEELAADEDDRTTTSPQSWIDALRRQR